MNKITYLDYSATTPTATEVFKFMEPFFTQKYGNASEPHSLGRQSSQAILDARKKIAEFVNANPDEIIFTGSATESINLSHKGLIEALFQRYPKREKLHIITSSIEHKAVLETCKHLENLGKVEITYLPVDQYGKVSVEDVEKAIKEETVLVSIMYVNNEIGTIEPIKEIGRLIKKINSTRQGKDDLKIYFHTDATQAVQYLDSDVNDLGVDFLSFTGHKIYAPKGIGVLFFRKGTPLVRQIDGGKQEFGLRGGTENVPYIAALGEAVAIASKYKKGESERLTNLRDKLIEALLKIPDVNLTGHPTDRAPHIASFTVEGAEGESIVLLLSMKGIIASSGSACTSHSLQPSHVLTAIGVAPEVSHGSTRFSLGRDTTEGDITEVVEVFPKIVEQLRIMAPKL